jgi:hypothetical protein
VKAGFSKSHVEGFYGALLLMGHGDKWGQKEATKANLFENSSLQDCPKFAICNRRKSHKAIAMLELWLLDFWPKTRVFCHHFENGA